MQLTSVLFTMLAMAVLPSSISFELLLSGSSMFTKSITTTQLNRASRFATLTRMLLTPNKIAGSKFSKPQSRSCSSSSHDHESRQFIPAPKITRPQSSKNAPKFLIDVDENGTELSRRSKGRGRAPAAYVEQQDGNWHRIIPNPENTGSIKTEAGNVGFEDADELIGQFRSAKPIDSIGSQPPELAEKLDIKQTDPRWESPPKNQPPLDPVPWHPDNLPSSWVVFSDLHVSRATLSVCLRVLSVVRAEAERRKAGVIFLGDFWQDRGALRIEPLNAGEFLRMQLAWACERLSGLGQSAQVLHY
jgi:hypothetical protein